MILLSLLACAPSFTSAWPSFEFGSIFGRAEPKVSPRVTVPLKKQYVPVSRNGSVVAYKTAYFGDVFVGSPQQAFTVVFDTGSGHLILPSLGCDTETCVKHRRFDRLASKTSQDIEHDGTPIPATATTRDQVSISFGTGQVVGEFIEDQTCIGADTATPLCSSLRVVLANQMSPEPFGLFDFDGVLGLGLDALTLNQQFSFFGRMATENPTLQKLFSVFLSRDEESGLSSITFGGHDADRRTSEIQYAPVARDHLGYWQVQIKSVRIGENVLEDCQDGECHAVLDTGTSLLGVPRQSSRTMHHWLARPVPEELLSTDGSAGAVDCRGVPGADLVFELADGLIVTLAPEDYRRPAPVNVTVSNTSKPYCRSLLLPLDMKAPLGPKIFIWGEPMLRKYYTIYDWGQKRIGFANANHTTDVREATEGSNSTGNSGGGVGTPASGSLIPGAPLASAVAA